MSAPTADNPLGLPPPPFPDDLGRGPMIVGVTWTFAALAIIVVAARFAIRMRVTRCLGMDDWLMLAAVTFLVAFQGCLTQSFHLGMGKRDINLTWNQTKGILKWTFISIPPLSAASILARISVSVMLLRIFGRKKWFKLYLVVFTTISVLAVSLVVILVWASASPVEGLWDPLLPARRWDPTIPLYAAYTAGSICTFADLTYVLWPVLIIWNLQMPSRQKIGLTLLMVMSLFTVAMSIMKTYYAQANPHSTTDVQYYASLSNLWSSLEASFVILMGSVPPLRPIAKLEFPTLRSIGSSIFGSLHALQSERSNSDVDTERMEKATGFSSSGEFTARTGEIQRTDSYGVTYEQRR